MDDDDGSRARRNRALRGRGVHIERVGIDIDEDRPRSDARDRAGRREEAVGRRHHLVARPYAKRHQRDEERIAPGRDPDRVRGAAVRSQLAFEPVYLRTEDEMLAIHHAPHRFVDLSADARVLRR